MGACNSRRRRSAPVVGVHKSHSSYREDFGEGITTARSESGRTGDGDIGQNGGHHGAILGIASADTEEFLTCGEDKSLRLHRIIEVEEIASAHSFRNRLTFCGHSKQVVRAVYSAASRLAYSCSRDCTLRQWKTFDDGDDDDGVAGGERSGVGGARQALQAFQGHTLACTALALNADDETLCSGSRDTSLRIWDVRTGICVASTSVPRNMITCLKWLPADASSSSSALPSNSIVQGGEDLRLRVWDTRDGGMRSALVAEGYTFFPLCIDVSANAHDVLTSSKGFDGAGCETKLWDLRKTASPVREYTGHTQDTVACLFLRCGDNEGRGRAVETGATATKKDGVSSRMIATASKDGTIKIYDQDSGKTILDHHEPESGGYTGLTVQRDPCTGCQVLFASTITGGLYAFRLGIGGEEARGEGRGAGDHEGSSLRLRCIASVQGDTIL